MLTAILICGTACMFTSCTDVNDNPAPATVDNEGTPTDGLPEGIDASEFQPTDLSVALLGSVSNYAEEEVVKYWFTNVSTQVTDQTQVVITDEINASNEGDIIKVLQRYGTLLLLDPSEANVRQYAEAMGVNPETIDFPKVELIGFSGFGDQFISYYESEEGEEDALNEPLTPASISSKDIWDVAPMEYLRVKAFAQWAEKIEKKYTEYQEYLAEQDRAYEEAIAAEEAGFTRANAQEEEGNSDAKMDIEKMRGEDISIHLSAKPKFKSFHNNNATLPDDEDYCPLSVTCDYHIKSLFGLPSKQGADGTDYYIIQTSVGWDCSETLLETNGTKEHEHGFRNRRSFLFFPCQCAFYSTPLPTSANYRVSIPSGGDLKPDEVPVKKSVTNTRSFNIDANVSAGSNAGYSSEGPSVGGEVKGGLGMGANWSKSESFTVEEYKVGKNSPGISLGHVITVPDGDDGYRPRMKNKSLNQGFEIPQGVNFKKTLSTAESWIWKVDGTQVGSTEEVLGIRFTAKPTVSWSSYFWTYIEWGVKESSHEMSKEFKVSAPRRRDIGFVKVDLNTKLKNVAGTDKTDCNLYYIRVINKANQKVTEMKKYMKYGKTLTLCMPAGKYDIELDLGVNKESAKTYIYTDCEVQGHSSVEELDTDGAFEIKK